MEADIDQDDTESTIIDNEIDFLWKVVFKDNQEGLDYEKFFLHPNNWCLYINQKLFLIKVGYYVELLVSYVKKFIWEVV